MKIAPIRLTADLLTTDDARTATELPRLPEGVERLELWPDGRVIAWTWDTQREATPEERALLLGVELQEKAP